VSVFVVDITDQVQTRHQAEAAAQTLREQRAVGQAVLEAQEEERRRIAEALHNGIGQLLTAAHLHLEGVAVTPAGLRAAEQILYQAIEAVRRLSAELTPSVLEELGLARALRQLSGLYPPQRLHVHWHLEGLDAPLPRPLAIAVYRLVQELLTNVVKHAHTPEARVHVVRELEQVVVIVEDNGVGFGAGAPDAQPAGVGLLSLRHRVLALGGHVSIQSQPGRGTIVSLELPLAEPTHSSGASF
jgi:signal transduction histidine kinase